MIDRLLSLLDHDQPGSDIPVRDRPVHAISPLWNCGTDGVVCMTGHHSPVGGSMVMLAEMNFKVISSHVQVFTVADAQFQCGRYVFAILRTQRDFQTCK